MRGWADSRPATGLVVRLYAARPAESAARPLLAEGVTGPGGAFRLDCGSGVPELLHLEGAAGVGRVRLASAASEPLRLAYPVRTTVLLLHDNDLHFNINHRAAFQAEVARLRTEHANVFLLNAGDLFIRSPGRWNQPTPAFYAARSRAVIDWMNAMRYDAATLGNHELDYVGDLTREALERAAFPLLAANIERSTERLPPWRPFVVLRTDNELTLFVLGLSCINFKKPGLAMADPLQTTLGYRAEGAACNARIGLTHLGLPLDQVLARSACGFDVILGGHCHTLLEEALLAGGVLVAQAGGTPADRPNPVDPSRPKFLGIVTLEFENDRLAEKSGRVLTFD